jgi:riboflavin synthase
MFTGLIETVGTLRSLEDGVLLIEVDPGAWPDPIQTGESVAVNGCCLTTLTTTSPLRFDLSPETLSRTALGGLSAGSRVNLERAMRADGRFGGHIVQGHVDATATFVGSREEGNSVVMRFRVPDGAGKYLVPKGSICLNGVSLTVVDPTDQEFEVWVIPHTLKATSLGDLQPGDRLNVEYDHVVKIVERLNAFSK